MAARTSGVRRRSASGVFSGGGVRPATVCFLLSGRALRARREERERERGNGTVREMGVSRGLFIGSAGPPCRGFIVHNR